MANAMWESKGILEVEVVMEEVEEEILEAEVVDSGFLDWMESMGVSIH